MRFHAFMHGFQIAFYVALFFGFILMGALAPTTVHFWGAVAGAGGCPVLVYLERITYRNYMRGYHG